MSRSDGQEIVDSLAGTIGGFVTFVRIGGGQSDLRLDGGALDQERHVVRLNGQTLLGGDAGPVWARGYLMNLGSIHISSQWCPSRS